MAQCCWNLIRTQFVNRQSHRRSLNDFRKEDNTVTKENQLSVVTFLQYSRLKIIARTQFVNRESANINAGIQVVRGNALKSALEEDNSCITCWRPKSSCYTVWSLIKTQFVNRASSQRKILRYRQHCEYQQFQRKPKSVFSCCVVLWKSNKNKFC